MSIKNLIFDVDGTIWNSTEVVARAWRQAVRDAEVSDLYITADMLKKEFGKPMDEIFASLFPDMTDSKIKAKMAKFIYSYEERYLVENTEDLTYPGMKEEFFRLAKKYNIYIVSNCQAGYIELVMDKVGIRECIKDWDCFGYTGLPKSGTIRKLMEKNALEDKETVYIGDTNGDFTATKEAGLKFVFASFGFGEVANPDATIEKIDDLEEAIKNL